MSTMTLDEMREKVAPKPKRSPGRPRMIRTHEYQPRGAAKALFKSKAGEVLLSGPAGTGKSRGCMEKLHAMALLNTDMRGLILRKTAVSLTNSGLVTWREKVAKESIAGGHCSWYGGSSQEAAGYRYTNGSVINVGGLDKSAKIMSTEYDAVFVQEATECTEDDWQDITSRLRNGRVSFSQLMADCNPSFEHHWLNRRCQSGQTLMLESRHEDNPLFFDESGQITRAGKDYIEGKLDKLTGVRYLRLRKGLWVSAEGLVWEDWDPAVHLVNKFKIPEEWRRFWVIDFGFKNPFVCQFWAEDPDGRLFMYREIYMTNKIVEEHAKDILATVQYQTGAKKGEWHEPKPSAVICDHDAEDRATFEKHTGLKTVAAKKTVSDGLQAFAARLKARRIFILRDSLVKRDQSLVDAKKPTCFAEEIVGYIWEPGKEKPVKEDDHSCDTGRYMAAHRDLQKSAGIRVLEW